MGEEWGGYGEVVWGKKYEQLPILCDNYISNQLTQNFFFKSKEREWEPKRRKGKMF